MKVELHGERMGLPQPILAYGEDGALAALADAYHVEAWPVGVWICAGFAFDGASIPQAARPLIGGPWDERRLPAATVHDWLYASHVVPRWLADLVFLRLLVANGHGWWRSLVDWWAVSRFGRDAWDAHGPEENAETAEAGCISFTGVNTLVAKVAAAIVTSGGSTAGDAALTLATSLYNKFKSAGGDETKASVVTGSDGAVSITDGKVTETATCTDGSCTVK